MRNVLPLPVCLAACGLALGHDFAGLKPQGYVSDFASAVDPASRQQLGLYARQLQDATGVQLAVVTLPGLAGEPIEEVANDLFRKWGIGQKGNNGGLLLLLVPRERRFRMEVGYGLEEIVPDGYAGSVLRAMRPALRESRYGEALLQGVHEVGARIATAKGVKLVEGTAPRRRQQRIPESSLPILTLLGGLAVFAILCGATGCRRARRYYYGGNWLPAALLGGLAGRAWGSSHSGGGFGGYDSGDGFGGFGGGDSGGGGASSSW